MVMRRSRQSLSDCDLVLSEQLIFPSCGDDPVVVDIVNDLLRNDRFWMLFVKVVQEILFVLHWQHWRLGFIFWINRPRISVRNVLIVFLNFVFMLNLPFFFSIKQGLSSVFLPLSLFFNL